MRSPRTAAGGVVVALVAVLLVWFVFVYRPRGEELEDVRERVREAQSQEQSLRATLERLEDIDTDRPAIEADLRRLSAAVPPQPELAAFILALHDVAERSGIEFMSITPAPPARQAGASLSAIAVSVNAEGRFFTVLDFLHRLEELGRLVVVDAVTLTRLAQAAAPGAPAAAAAATATGVPTSVPVDPDAVVEVPTGNGVVVTDAATLAASQVLTASPSAGSPIQEALRISPEQRVSLQVQARTFTTAAPFAGAEEEAAEEGGGAPGPAEGGATTTTSTTTREGG